MVISARGSKVDIFRICPPIADAVMNSPFNDGRGDGAATGARGACDRTGSRRRAERISLSIPRSHTVERAPAVATCIAVSDTGYGNGGYYSPSCYERYGGYFGAPYHGSGSFLGFGFRGGGQLLGRSLARRPFLRSYRRSFRSPSRVATRIVNEVQGIPGAAFRAKGAEGPLTGQASDQIAARDRWAYLHTVGGEGESP